MISFWFHYNNRRQFSQTFLAPSFRLKYIYNLKDNQITYGTYFACEKAYIHKNLNLSTISYVLMFGHGI